MKENIFLGPKITQIFEDQNFITKLNATERRAWKAFENVCIKFRGNEKAENCLKIVKKLISPYCANTSLKIHFPNSHLNFFLQTLEPSPMNMAKGSIRLFPKLKRGTVENGILICWLTTAGVLQGIQQMAKIRDKGR
jgi:hypothetical protein